MQSNYQDCLGRVLQSEGGYTNDPKDPGGPTNYGITIYDYRMYINSKGTASDVKNMSKSQAETIYKSKYWDKVNGDSLPSGVDYTVFDYGVNSGVNRANQVYNKLKSDNPDDTINAINDERLKFLEGLSTWSHFGRGWESRVSSVRQHSLDLVKQPTSDDTPGLGIISQEVDQATGLWTTIKNFLSDNFHHASAGTVAATGSAIATQTHYWPYVLAGTVGLALIVWLGIWIYKRNHNANL